MDPLVSLIHSNSITPLMPNPFQIDSDIQNHIPKTKTPNILQNLDKIDHLQTPHFSHKAVQNSSNRHANLAGKLELELLDDAKT